MQTVASMDRVGCVDDMVRSILQIETSEINPVFMEIIEATDSSFVRTLGPFRRAVRQHIDYICKQIAALTPSAAIACRELLAMLQ